VLVFPLCISGSDGEKRARIQSNKALTHTSLMDHILLENGDQSFMRKGKFIGIQGGNPWLEIVINENDQDTYMPSFSMDDFDQVHVISLSPTPTQMPRAMKMVLEQVQSKKSDDALRGEVVPKVRFSFRFDEDLPLMQIKHLHNLMGFKTHAHDDLRKEYDASGKDDELDFVMSVCEDMQVCGTIGGVEFNFSVPYTKHDREWHNDVMSYYPTSCGNQDLDKFYSRTFYPFIGTYEVEEIFADGRIMNVYYDDTADENKLGSVNVNDESEVDADNTAEDVVCHSAKRARHNM